MNMVPGCPFPGRSDIYQLIFGSGPQIEMRVLFIFAAILLLSGSLWLLAVRLSSSSLRGLGWLSGAAALSGGGLFLSACYGPLPLILSVVLAGELKLLSNVLIELSLIELLENEARIPKFNLAIVALSMLALPFVTYEHADYRLRATFLSAMMLAQISRNAWLLWSLKKLHLRHVLRFTLVGMFLSAVFQAVKIVIMVHYWVPRSPLTGNWYDNISLFCYLLCSLWVISGFFWLTTLQLTSKLENMAGTDPLTRLANRRVFREWMQREHLRSLRTGVPFSLLIVDLDHFKRVNDTMGHNAGDEVIRVCVERMQDSVRGIDVLGRWGGEEFVALLPRATVDAAELVAERIRRNIEEPIKLKVRGEEKLCRITVSLGITSYRGGEDTIEDMFDRADRALYAAKEAGRNCILTAA
ncbi:GGDEF domain-containing protein [Terriglobus roseus]|nr:GGDEF domain-containing protein [Terriglobus roseus]